MLRHQKKAKYCLNLRGLKSNKVYNCSCGKIYTRLDNLKRHEQVCDYIPESHTKVEERSEMIQFMTKVVEALSSKNSTVTNINNNTINLQPITHNYLEITGNQHLTKEIVKEGRQPELAVKVLDGYIKVSDKSRKKIKYKDADGNISTNNKKLLQNFYKAIAPKNKKLADKLYGDIQTSVNEIIAEGRAGESDLTKLLTAGTELQDRLITIKNIVDGIDNDGTTKLLDETIKCVVSDLS